MEFEKTTACKFLNLSSIYQPIILLKLDVSVQVKELNFFQPNWLIFKALVIIYFEIYFEKKEWFEKMP